MTQEQKKAFARDFVGNDAEEVFYRWERWMPKDSVMLRHEGIVGCWEACQHALAQKSTRFSNPW